MIIDYDKQFFKDYYEDIARPYTVRLSFTDRMFDLKVCSRHLGYKSSIRFSLRATLFIRGNVLRHFKRGVVI
jgi:hypothetical protein